MSWLLPLPILYWQLQLILDTWRQSLHRYLTILHLSALPYCSHPGFSCPQSAILTHCFSSLPFSHELMTMPPHSKRKLGPLRCKLPQFPIPKHIDVLIASYLSCMFKERHPFSCWRTLCLHASPHHVFLAPECLESKASHILHSLAWKVLHRFIPIFLCTPCSSPHFPIPTWLNPPAKPIALKMPQQAISLFTLNSLLECPTHIYFHNLVQTLWKYISLFWVEVFLLFIIFWWTYIQL